jgi:hypothetical protein
MFYSNSFLVYSWAPLDLNQHDRELIGRSVVALDRDKINKAEIGLYS